jgi:hypothetical protein
MDFSDRDTAELADLRRRVNELERRIGRSWMVHGNVVLRIFAVWGYFLLGYIMLLAIAFPVILVIRLVTGGWP